VNSVLLQEVCFITMGQAPPSSSYNKKELGFPLIAGAGDFGIKTPDYKQFTTSATRISKPGDIILCIRATIGNCNWSNKEYCLGRGVAGLRAIEGKLNKEYLWYWLEIAKPELIKKAKGSTFKQVDKATIQNLKIPLPPLEEQRRIAAILDKADEIRRKRKEAIRLTDELLRSVFLDMFGDPVTNPKGWEVVELGKISKIQGGLQVTSKRKNNPLEIPYLRVANVYRDKLLLDEIKLLRVTPDELERVKLQVGDLLVVEGHGNNQEIGRSCVWDGSIRDCIHQNHLIRVRIDPKRAEPTFISAYLNSAGGRRQLTKFGKTTSGLNTISTSNVKATKVICPPIEMQRKYLTFQKKIIIKTQNDYVQYLKSIDNLFNALMQRAFKGEL